MLSEVVLAHYAGVVDEPHAGGALTVTGISPCPYGTYLNYHHLDTREPSSLGRLRMKNGNYQEAEILEDLRNAGYSIRCTGKDQIVLHVGKVPITGRPDGLITMGDREDALSIKAMSLSRFTSFRRDGLKAEPFIESQEQLYLASEEFRSSVVGTWVYAKHKDTCRPYDLFVEKDLSYSAPIIEFVEEIILGKQEVSRPSGTLSLCSHCRHRLFCWGEDQLDLGTVKIANLPEAAEKWREGKSHQDYGKILEEEAREVFEVELGKDLLMVVEDLKIQRVSPSASARFSESKFVRLYGAQKLVEVMDVRQRRSYIRVDEV